MKLFEYEAKNVAQKSGIAVPTGIVVGSPEEAKKAFNEIGRLVVLKSQVLVAGRKKAGGIKFADTAEETYSMAEELLRMEIKGEPVKQLLIEERVPIKRELYVGVVVNRSSRCYTVLASGEGGVDIEQIASESPEMIFSREVDPVRGFREYEGREVARKLGYSGKQLVDLGSVITRIFGVAVNYDCELAESNPLIETVNGGFVAADFRILLDDNALYRHREYQQAGREADRELTMLESKAREKGLAYVDLEGDIGIVGNGAGLVMATLDAIQHHGGKPANFCDMGGGADVERIVSGMELVLSKSQVRVLFLNVLGGITRCDDVAKAVVNIKERGQIKIPIVIRMVGTNEEAGKSILSKAGIQALDSMEEAAREAVAAAKR